MANDDGNERGDEGVFFNIFRDRAENPQNFICPVKDSNKDFQKKLKTLMSRKPVQRN